MAKKIVKKKVKRARRNTKLLFLNMITILLMASSTAYLVYILNSLQMIPQLWLILGAIILVALFLLNCILALLKIPYLTIHPLPSNTSHQCRYVLWYLYSTECR